MKRHRNMTKLMDCYHKGYNEALTMEIIEPKQKYEAYHFIKALTLIFLLKLFLIELSFF